MDRPLIVQSDRTILLATDSPSYATARDLLARFAELERSPEHYHTYRITPLSLWNAAAAGNDPAGIIESMRELSPYPLPANVVFEIEEQMSRYGLLRLSKEGSDLVLTSREPSLLMRLARNPRLAPILGQPLGGGLRIPMGLRGKLKLVLLRLGWPVEDIAGYTPGAPLEVELAQTSRSGEPFTLRPYQRDAAEAFYAAGSEHGGSGVIVLPCGSGKTMVGLGAMALLKRQTLIVTTGITAARQWIRELFDKTNLDEDLLGEYSGLKKEIRPVTVTTYQTVTYRKKRSAPFPHFELFTTLDWGLIIYDEVHLLPAPVFRVTAEIQARRRLGLTATLIREDGKEGEVFSLIGPKRYDVPWKELEKAGWIAQARCYELRVDLCPSVEDDYVGQSSRRQQLVAGSNPQKDVVVEELIARHAEDRILIIGQYLDQLRRLSERLSLPLITGGTPQRRRDELYDSFRRGELGVLMVSKVGNFAVDLPEANVAIQISGTFGSRQEEAQRLGRILRPKGDKSPARFYSIVTARTPDEQFSSNRQLFLTEQGYRYYILRGEDLDLLDELD